MNRGSKVPAEDPRWLQEQIDRLESQASTTLTPNVDRTLVARLREQKREAVRRGNRK